MLRLIGRRLQEARYILLTCAVIAVLMIANGVALLPTLIGFIVVLAAAAVPGRARTLRLKARETLQQARPSWHQTLRLATDSVDLPAIILTADGHIFHQNGAANRIFGNVQARAHISINMRSPEILKLVENGIADSQVQTLEYFERVPTERWFLVRIGPMSSSLSVGGKRLYIVTFSDLTETRRLDRMRSDFVANASHELRTPLAALTGFIETLSGSARDDVAARTKFLGIMHEQAARMSRLVDDLLSLSRLELKAHLPLTDEVDLVSLLNHVIDSLRPLATEHGVELLPSLPDHEVLILGDSDELVQVFQNLIENACKYGSEGKRVVVALKEDDPPEVSVQDYGPGIPKEHVPRLTERFYRVSNQASTSKKGTGLGLSIVKHSLTRHRGRLFIRSSEGEGSTFTVRFSKAHNKSERS